ncbi:MAG: NUDIX hydrolase [Oribacterium sp.]|jgi:8-oxo-dGTP pyrophosphatase MutT (NUDIX family)|nr:NUDIX hydrolase [Oribacterium sp.]MDY6308966.1 NUDIX hydrolase [Oribacterium sp.]MDY6315642.1 NUDIX hydrolase [Oribacterium sp.]
MGERIDIYDREKKLTGHTKDRKREKLQPDEYMLYVLAILERPDHTFLITQRTMDKKWAPGSWEIPGGGVKAGETSFRAVTREVREETGLDVSCFDSLKPIYTYRNDDAETGDNYFCDIYRFTFPFEKEDVQVQEDEVLSFRLATMSEIKEIHTQDGFLHFERLMEALHGN